MPDTSVDAIIKLQDPALTVGVFVVLLSLMVVLAVFVYKPHPTRVRRPPGLPSSITTSLRLPREMDNVVT